MEDLFKDVPNEGDAINLGNLLPEETPADDKKKEQEEDEKEPDQEGESEEKPKKASEESSEDKKPEDKQNHAERRWKKLMERQKEKDLENVELKRQIETLSERFEDLTKTQKEAVADNVPPEFVKLFGENKEAWPLFKNLVVSQAEQLVSTREAKWTEQEKTKAKEVEEAKRYIDDQMEELSDEAGVDLTNPKSSMRNALFKIAQEFPVRDENGNLSFRKCLEIYRMRNPGKALNEGRKQAATISGQKSEASDVGSEDDLTVGALRGKSWRNFLKN